MSSRVKLTNEYLRSLVNDSGAQLWVFDSDNPGFGASCSPMGKKVFYQVGKVAGRTVRVKLGQFPGMTVQEARRKARAAAGTMSSGLDPRPKRRAETVEETFGAMFSQFMELHSKPTKRTWKRDQDEYDEHLSDWARLPLSAIDMELVASRVSKITSKNGRGTGHKVRALISSVFSFARRLGKVKYNPVSGTFRPTFEPRDRYIKPEEVARFFDAVRLLPAQRDKDFVMLVVWTGGRRSNVSSMEWTEIDFDAKTWTIPKSKFKGKRQHVIPLVGEAMEILLARRETGGDSRYVFPGQGKTGHYNNSKAAMNFIRSKSGIKDIRLHDLRRTLGAWQSNANVSLKIIQLSMGHADIRTTAKSYTPTETSAVRVAIEGFAAQMNAAIRRDSGLVDTEPSSRQ